MFLFLENSIADYCIFRILLISILVICIGNHQIYCIVSIQLVYFITITAIRPFDKIHLNIIKIQNEAYFLIFSIYMIYFCTESRWNQSLRFTHEFIGKISDMKPPETLFILLMTINCGSTMAIVFMVLIISTFKKLCKKTKSVASKPRPINFARSNAIFEEDKSEDIYPNSKNIESSKIGMYRQQIKNYNKNDRNVLHS